MNHPSIQLFLDSNYYYLKIILLFTPIILGFIHGVIGFKKISGSQNFISNTFFLMTPLLLSIVYYYCAKLISVPLIEIFFRILILFLFPSWLGSLIGITIKLKNNKEKQEVCEKYIAGIILICILLNFSFFYYLSDRAFKINNINRGGRWFVRGEYKKAEICYTGIINKLKNDAQVYLLRGYALNMQGKYEQAIPDYRKALEINPAIALLHLGEYLFEVMGKYDEAIKEYERILQIKPNDINTSLALAWILSTCPDERLRDGKKAVEIISKINNIEQNASILDTFAVCYAAASDFENAIKLQEEACKNFIVETDNKEILDLAAKRLNLYKNNKSWVEKPGVISQITRENNVRI